MRDRSYRSSIDAEEVLEPGLRKNVFRAMAGDLTYAIREDAVTDRPGAIARLMEAAYKAGREGAALSPSSRSARRRMTDMDVPSLPRDQMGHIRLFLFGGTAPERFERDPEQRLLALIMRPGIPGMPPSVSRDDWLLAFSLWENKPERYSNKTINPLIKLGLYDAVDLGTGGWRAALLTEWGFELMATGETAMPADRTPGTSTTLARYRACLGDGRAIRAAAIALGVLKDDAPSPRGP